MKFKQICVLGGTGFIGHHVVERLAEQGYSIKLLSRARERHRDLLVVPGVDIVEANIHDQAQLAREINGCDAVINLVGIIKERGFNGTGYRSVHVDLANKLIRACQAKGISRLLQVSVMGADASRGSSYYLRSKGEAEDLIAVAAKHNMLTTVFRPSLVFGAGDHFISRFAEMVKKAPGILAIPCAASRMSPVYVGDVAQAIVEALPDKSTYGKTYDLCGPHTYTLGEIFRYFSELTGHRRWFWDLGVGGSHVLAFLAELWPGKPFTVDNYRTLLTDCSGSTDDLKSFGIKPHPLESVAPLLLGFDHRQSHYNHLRRRGRVRVG
ncbi:MAG: complex I NDUFA9 subunit family protein [Gammaproteobacteria bacterium]|nr:complex I NDUFA9 subunit family protein [Gammaproteobacteria bacterium]